MPSANPKPDSKKPSDATTPDLRGPERTRHIRVTNWMREQILSGAWPVGQRLPSYNETRAQYGVHTSTMEKVFAQLESEGLIVRRRGSGTFVAERVKKARRKSSGIIGLSGGGLAYSGYSPYWSRVQSGAREAAARAQMQLMILEGGSSQGWEKVDGVLLCHWNEEEAILGQLDRSLSAALPKVSVMTQANGIASVVSDDYAAMKIAVEHLLWLGHRKIAFLHGYFDHEVMWNRVNAYHDTLEAAGIAPQENWTRSIRGDYFVGAQFSSQAHKYMSEWIKEDWREAGCSALICWNDESAVGAIRALNESGLHVPQDVSVIGFDGTEFCDMVTPRLSSLELPLHEIGSTAVEMLVRQIQKNEINVERRVLPVKLVERETTARLQHAAGKAKEQAETIKRNPEER